MKCNDPKRTAASGHVVFALVWLLIVDTQPLSAADAVFQYSFAVKTNKGSSAAFCWIPPAAPQVRGVLMAGMTLAERELVKDDRVRQACRDEQLAILFLKTGLSSVDLPAVLDEAAARSGYAELAHAPLFFAGHSAGGPQAKDAATKFRERCFGLMQYRGGSPVMGDAPLPGGIPALMMLGQFDEFGKDMMRNETGRENWENGRDSMAAFRAAGGQNLGSFVVEPGAGHFAWSDRSASYFALFLRLAAQTRIPRDTTLFERPIRCREIDPNAGWLSDLTIKPPVQHSAAPAREYRGKKEFASWHFNRELADATTAYHAGLAGKRDQFLRWTDPGVSVEAGARNFFSNVRWMDDGQTFAVHPVFSEVIPRTQKDGRGPRWPRAGEPAGNSGDAIRVRVIGGAAVLTGPDAMSFRIRHDSLAPATESGRVTFLAYVSASQTYRATELVGMLAKDFGGITSGQEQTIRFDSLPDLTVGSTGLDLKATSDAGLPVEFHVGYGPIIIENQKLRLAEIPARAKFPIEAKVIAYQFGRGIAPQVKTAVAVQRTFRIVAKE